MKPMLRLLPALLLVGVLGVPSTRGETTPAEGTISRLIGQATVRLPGATEDIPVQAGDRIPTGAVLTTGENSRLMLRTFDGAVTTLGPATTLEVEEISTTRSAGEVTRETSRLALRSGNLVSTLDPRKRAVNDYGVRTPKGVAAARGTVFSVEVLASGITNISASDGALSITFGGQVYTIAGGTISIDGAPPIPVAEAASNPATAATINKMMDAAVEAISEVVEQGTDLSPETSAAVIANVTQAAVTSAIAQEAAAATNSDVPPPTRSPEQITQRVVAAVTAPTASTAGSAEAVTAAVGSVTQAAATGVISGSAQAAASQAIAAGATAEQAQAAATAAGTAAAARVTTVTTAATTAVNTSAAANPTSTAATAASTATAAAASAGTTAVQNATTLSTQAAAPVVTPPATVTPPAQTTPQVPVVDPTIIVVSPSS